MKRCDSVFNRARRAVRALSDFKDLLLRPTITPKRTIRFDQQLDAEVIQDAQSRIRGILHTHKPVMIQAASGLEAATTYLSQHGHLVGVTPKQLENLRIKPGDKPTPHEVEYQCLIAKQQFELSTITFQQTWFGIPVWHSAVSVHARRMDGGFAVVASGSSAQHGKAFEGLKRSGVQRHDPCSGVDLSMLARQLGLAEAASGFEARSLQLCHANPVIYPYQRKSWLRRARQFERATHCRLRPSAEAISDGLKYATAVYFELKRKSRMATQWLAILEVGTNALLYLDELAGGLNGLVFDVDPATQGGPAPSAGDAQLNGFRKLLPLTELQAGANTLRGKYVQVSDFTEPANVVPSVENRDLIFHARTDEFAAVNAYYHCERFFGLVDDLGLKCADYFPNQTFPVPVDARGWCSESSDYTTADAQTNPLIRTAPDGSLVGEISSVLFQLADTNVDAPLGLACDWRVVLHELGGHGTLLNHIACSKFGFAHSAGDSFAAILNDPASKLPKSKRGRTFPWLFDQPGFDRRHDRHSPLWAWDGKRDVQDDNLEQLDREQILSSSHFRLYRSIGGDSGELERRNFAATYCAYLILSGINELTPPTNPQHASDWYLKLTAAEAGDWLSAGQSGGAYLKVIRWAFEKQGLFGGHPPSVDVYIDDGRHGEYGFIADHTRCLAIWNRRQKDGLTSHQAPAAGLINFVYVKLRNRGSATAGNVVVQAYRNNDQTSFEYPTNWTALTPGSLSAPDVAPGSSGRIAGPFEWIPSADTGNAILVAVSASGDPSNLAQYSPVRRIPDWRLVPNDNNIAMRKM